MNDTKHTSSIIQNSKKRRVRRPGSRKQRNTVLFVIIVLAAAVTAAYFVFSPKEETYNLRNYISEKVQLETIQDILEISGVVNVRYQTNILASESGVLESVLVSEGDWVEANQIVAVIKAENLENSLNSLQRQLTAQLRNYERFLLLQKQNLLGISQQRQTLQSTISDAEEQLSSAIQLYNLGSATRQNLESAEEQFAEAETGLVNFDQEQMIAQQLFELDNLDYQDTLQEIRDDIKTLEAQLTNTRIRTPIGGQVVTSIDDLAVGTAINSDAFIMEIADISQPVVEAAIEEQYVSYISEGHQVMIAVSGHYFPGSIEKIGLSAQTPSNGGTPTVSLEIAIEPGEQLVIPGSSAVISLVLQEIDNALVLPRGQYLTTGNKQYVYRIEGNEARRIDITVGSVTETLVQILTGVSAGDEIITSSYHQYIDFETVQIGETDD